jgi:hypothetical protein
VTEALLKQMEEAYKREEDFMASRCIELRTALQDILHRFQSAIGAGGEIEGDRQAINRAMRALRMD